MEAENQAARASGKRACVPVRPGVAAKRRRSDGPSGAFDELVSTSSCWKVAACSPKHQHNTLHRVRDPARPTPTPRCGSAATPPVTCRAAGPGRLRAVAEPRRPRVRSAGPAQAEVRAAGCRQGARRRTTALTRAASRPRPARLSRAVAFRASGKHRLPRLPLPPSPQPQAGARAALGAERRAAGRVPGRPGGPAGRPSSAARRAQAYGRDRGAQERRRLPMRCSASWACVPAAAAAAAPSPHIRAACPDRAHPSPATASSACCSTWRRSRCDRPGTCGAAVWSECCRTRSERCASERRRCHGPAGRRVALAAGASARVLRRAGRGGAPAAAHPGAVPLVSGC